MSGTASASTRAELLKLAGRRGETEIQSAILQALAFVPGEFWRNNTGVVRAVGQGGRERLITYGVPGSADIEGVLPSGRFVGIEVKRPGEELSQVQRRWHARMRAVNALLITARSVEDALRGLGSA